MVASHRSTKCQLSGPRYGARSVSVFGASPWKPSLPTPLLANHGCEKSSLIFVHFQIACLNRIVLPDPGEEDDDDEDDEDDDEDGQDEESGTDASDA